MCDGGGSLLTEQLLLGEPLVPGVMYRPLMVWRVRRELVCVCVEGGRISIGTGCESQTMTVGGEVLHLHDSVLFCFSN